MKKVNIGVAGLGFGKEFAAIYCDHPLVDKVRSVQGIPKL